MVRFHPADGRCNAPFVDRVEMNNEQRLQVFIAQCDNVRGLASAFKQTKRVINQSLRRNKDNEVRDHTRTLALIYCAWSEASFSKMVHTPHGFTLDEIKQIKEV